MLRGCACYGDLGAAMRVQMCIERGRYEDATVYQPDTVLRQATLDGARALRRARALGLAEVTGSLTPGKKADLVMPRADDLNLGPLNVADGQIVLAAQPRNVDTVWIDGVVRKQHGELVDVDVPAAMKAASAAVAGLSERIGGPVV
jgi:5-methylthioadenosine/S-adenosylhomocysteine deaminase